MTEIHDRDPVLLTYPAPSIAEIRLNAPELLNAVDETTFVALMGALNAIERRGDIRAVLLSGEGRAFCAGANYKHHVAGNRTPAQREAYVDVLLDGCARLAAFAVPIVVVIQGYAVGIGLEMALNCDFIVIAEDAQIGFPEIGIATFVGGGVTRTLVRSIGLGQARRMIMLGEWLKGSEAHALGLATLSVPSSGLRDAAVELAGRIAQQAPVPIAFAKKILNADTDLVSARSAEREAVFACMRTEDWREGVRAFAEKRKPSYVGC